MAAKRRLSSTHRIEIASNMTRAAIKNKLAKLVKAGGLESKALLDYLAAECQAALPELSKERVQELIQNRALNSLGTLGHSFSVSKTEKAKTIYVDTSDSYSIARITEERNGHSNVRSADEARLRNIFSGQTLGIFGFSRSSYRIEFTLCLTAAHLPAVRSDRLDYRVESKESPQVQASLKRLNKLLQQWRELVLASEGMYQDVLDSLAPINTVPQFLEFYPDQEHHLPADLYAAPVKALVSMKLVDTVRQRLMTGIPD